MIFGPAIGWNSAKKIHFMGPSFPQPSKNGGDVLSSDSLFIFSKSVVVEIYIVYYKNVIMHKHERIKTNVGTVNYTTKVIGNH